MKGEGDACARTCGADAAPIAHHLALASRPQLLPADPIRSLRRGKKRRVLARALTYPAGKAPSPTCTIIGHELRLSSPSNPHSADLAPAGSDLPSRPRLRSFQSEPMCRSMQLFPLSPPASCRASYGRRCPCEETLALSVFIPRRSVDRLLAPLPLQKNLGSRVLR